MKRDKKKKRRSVEERFLLYTAVILFLVLAIGTSIVENVSGKNAGALPLSTKQPFIIFSFIVSVTISFLLIQKQKKDDAKEQQEKEKKLKNI